MIIRAMAITRCPYCHAIIDENVKYCNNCGTQLLFADDEGVDEEIPGEKIIDADTEEKDYTVEEPEGESKPKEDQDLEEELEEETEEVALDKLVAEEAEDVTEEVILFDEIEAAEASGKDEPKESGEKEKTSEIIKPDKDEDEDEEEEEKKEPEKEDAEEEDEAEPAEETAPQPVTFDTQELEGIGEIVELRKEEI